MRLRLYRLQPLNRANRKGLNRVAANNDREESKQPAMVPKRDSADPKRKAKKGKMKNKAPRTCLRAEKWKLPAWLGESDSQEDAESLEKGEETRGDLEGEASGSNEET